MNRTKLQYLIATAVVLSIGAYMEAHAYLQHQKEKTESIKETRFEPKMVDRDIYMDETFVTVCTHEEAGRALSWQGSCAISNQTGMAKSRCSLMSYLRYCQPTTRREVLDNGWQPLKKGYNNVFLRG